MALDHRPALARKAPLAPDPRAAVALVGVLALALVLRLWGIDFGLPYVYHPDEPRYVDSALLLFRTLNIDPKGLPYLTSSAFVYVINALAYAAYYAIGSLAGTFHGVADLAGPRMINLGVGVLATPAVFAIGRTLTLTASMLSVWLVFRLGRRLARSPWVGILAALALAVSPTAVYHAHLITPDTYVVVFALLVFSGCLEIAENGAMRLYALTGLALGCLLSTKISGGIMVLPILIAHVINGRNPLKRLPQLVVLGTVALLAALATTPYLLADPGRVIGDIWREGRHYASGHPGMEGDTLQWYLSYLWQTEGVLALLALVGIAVEVGRNPRQGLLLAVFPVAYFVFICTYTVRNDRTLLPMLPFVHLFAALFIMRAWGAAVARRWAVPIRLSIAAVMVLALAGPFRYSFDATRQLATTDSRETARVWINEHLPAGSTLAFEAYTPFVDASYFKLAPIGRIIDREAAAYRDAGIDYAIVGEWMFGRFYAEPEKYPVEVGKYEAFFALYPLEKAFNDGGYEVRIYRVSAR